MESLTRSRGYIKARVTRFTTYVNKLTDTQADSEQSLNSEQINEMRQRLDDIIPLLSEYYEIDFQILESDPNAEAESDFENAYYAVVAKVKALLNQYENETEKRSISPSSSNRSNSVNSGSSIRLPTISIPKFSGDTSDWLEYFEIFKSLVHENDSLNDIKRLHYLKASLQGDAAQIIKSLEFTASNYSVAWKALCERYNDPRMLVYNHFKAIFDLEACTKESASKLRKINDSLFKHFTALKSLESDQSLLEFMIIFVVSKKLDSNTFREWEVLRNAAGAGLPTLSDFKEFLKNTANLLETLESKQGKILPEKHPRLQSKSFVSNTLSCVYCQKDHALYRCDEFAKLSTNSRISKAKLLGVCLNCLSKGHFIDKCTSKFKCRKCKGKHNTLLHEDKPQTKSKGQPETSISTDSVEPNKTISAFCSNDVQVLLPTATAKIISNDGSYHTARILLDSGSQSNFIRSDFCKRLNLQTLDSNITVSGLGKATSRIRSRCDVKLQAPHTNFKMNIACLVLDEITGDTPSFCVKRNSFKIPPNIQLSDPTFDKPGTIDILIGSPAFWQLLCIGQVQLGINLPILQKTRLGWVISGPTATVATPSVQCNLSCFEDPTDSLARFWQIEHYPTEKVRTVEENACEAHFIETTRRDSNGRFIVSIPLKQPVEVLGDSYQVAQNRFLSLERRLQANPVLATRYYNFIQEYIDLGHMSVTEPNSSEISYYLPHHGVQKEESLTTKLRVVFNGSQNTTTGHSLNSIQLVGPTIQQDLFSILVRFRKHAVAIAADIEKMYRQVLVEPSQRCLQRILWRSSPAEPIHTYNLNTVTYGTASASFLAIRSLTQLGNECEVSSPDVSRVIKEDFYVDDLLSGASTQLHASNLCAELNRILSSGCFQLRKWISNHPQVLEGIPDSHIHPGVLEFGDHEHTRTLGLIWFFQHDHLMYTISNASNVQVTKRNMLSEIAQIFDPLGLISPCTITAKIMLQQLWTEKLAWDDPVPKCIQAKWSSYRNELVTLNDLKIQRHVLCKQPTEVELHGFCDASINGFGACIFIRSKDEEGRVQVNLLCSKSRVSPLKPLTIPKLELCGAVLLAKLTEQVQKAFDLPISRCFFWSDSTVVLGWLKTSPNMLKTFVCNRVADIQQLTSHGTWRHVPTKCNPADLLSRGVPPQFLKESNLWWHGPPWLCEDESSWPISNFTRTELPEMKRESQCISVTTREPFPFDYRLSLFRLTRVTAYCLRFRNNPLKSQADRLLGPFTADELKESLLVLVKLSQQESFPDELKLLSQGKPLRSSSSLISLNPFLDSKGMLRVGGRLHNSQFSYDKKFPLLISGKHPLTKPLVTQEHLRLLHAGPQLLLSNLRDRYWIISGRNIVKQVVHRCLKCFRLSPQLTEPIMGNLPSSRLQPTPPFHVTGVDYGGPFLIKDRKGRGSKTIKSYLCLFICFATKAVHLELVTDLSTETFLMAFRRFVARRGKPLHVYSDNGTNFVGAQSELRELGTFLKEQSSAIPESVTSEGINWHFIPAHSPHFGGLWEAGIKSSKFHLRRVIGNTLLNFEEMSTLLSQVESTLNSRPISPLSADPSDLQPLTPAHFLIGRPSAALPDPDLAEVPESRLSIFQKVQKMHQHLWKRWNKEYVSELQQRSKWRINISQLAADALVLIKEDNTPPLRWKLGRVVELHPGNDGVNRVASVRTSNGIVKRSFAKLCPLPMDRE